MMIDQDEVAFRRSYLESMRQKLTAAQINHAHLIGELHSELLQMKRLVGFGFTAVESGDLLNPTWPKRLNNLVDWQAPFCLPCARTLYNALSLSGFGVNVSGPRQWPWESIGVERCDLCGVVLMTFLNEIGVIQELEFLRSNVERPTVETLQYASNFVVPAGLEMAARAWDAKGVVKSALFRVRRLFLGRSNDAATAEA